MIARTEGNPFFLEESVRSLVETGSLLGERGAYRLAQPLPAIQVPATVQAVLAARIDRLPAGDKALLQTASVVGKDVPFGLLQAIAGKAEDELLAGIEHLRAAEFLYEAAIFPEPEYTFKHALTHEVAYGSLLHDRRRTLHSQIVETIERLYPDRLAEHIERLAHHALRGEAWAKALAYLYQAGAKASARSAHQEAVSCFEQALAALPHLPESHEILEQAIDIHFDLARSLLPLGQVERSLQHIRKRRRPDEGARQSRTTRVGVDLHVRPPLAHGQLHGIAHLRPERAGPRREPIQDFPLQVAANHYLGADLLCFGRLSPGGGALPKGRAVTRRRSQTEAVPDDRVSGPDSP